MNLRHTIELAALISAHSEHLLGRSAPLPSVPLQRFWNSSRKRLDRWLAALEEFALELGAPPGTPLQSSWDRIEPVIEEVFVTEVVTRVWGAVLTALDRTRGTQELEPLARNVLLGHLEARRRALGLMVTGAYVSPADVAQIDRKRRRIERWTDFLLGALVERFGVDDFAFDGERARDFGLEQRTRAASQQPGVVWDMILLSLRMAFPVDRARVSPNEDWHQEIVGSILACFPEEAFHPDGPFKSLLRCRIDRSGEQAEGPPRARDLTTFSPTPQPFGDSFTGGVSFASLRRQSLRPQ